MCQHQMGRNIPGEGVFLVTKKRCQRRICLWGRRKAGKTTGSTDTWKIGISLTWPTLPIHVSVSTRDRLAAQKERRLLARIASEKVRKEQPCRKQSCCNWERYLRSFSWQLWL